MKIHTEIEKERNVRIHKIQGLINVSELKEMLAGFYNSDDYDPETNSIWDLTGAETSAVTTEEVSSLATMVKKFWGRKGASKAALIVARDVDYGLSRMYEMHMSDGDSNNVMVFREYKEAEKWFLE